MMRKTQSKKIQNNTSNNNQKLLLAKNYLEQELETQGYRGHIKYDQANKALVQYRTQEGTIAIIKEGKLHIFEMPIKKFKGALPLGINSVDMDSIQTEKATCCKKCHQWKKTADITRCPCGGYLVPRKRFSVDAVESWDEEFLEIEFARKDIRAAKRTERILSNRPKRYVPTGITSKLAGISSTIAEKTPQIETLLIPKGDEVKTVPVRSVESCSLIFAAAIQSEKQILSGEQRAGILRECSTDDSEDRQFSSETKRFLRNQIPEKAKTMMDSWNEPYPFRQSGRNGKTPKRATKSLKAKSDRNHATEKAGLKNGKKTQFFASSVPVSAQALMGVAK